MIEWKNTSQWPDKQRRIYDKNDQATVEDLTRRAFASDDELAALLLVAELKGVGPATASAFSWPTTPIATRSWTRGHGSSLEAFKILGSPYHPGDEAWQRRRWTTYLRACRGVANDTGTELHQLDRALFQAEGRTALPGDPQG